MTSGLIRIAFSSQSSENNIYTKCFTPSSILYAVLATSFARSENILSTPPTMPALTASTPPPLRLCDSKTSTKSPISRTDLTAVYQPVHSLELFGLLMEADNPGPGDLRLGSVSL